MDQGRFLLEAKAGSGREARNGRNARNAGNGREETCGCNKAIGAMKEEEHLSPTLSPCEGVGFYLPGTSQSMGGWAADFCEDSSTSGVMH